MTRHNGEADSFPEDTYLNIVLCVTFSKSSPCPPIKLSLFICYPLKTIKDVWRQVNVNEANNTEESNSIESIM